METKKKKKKVFTQVIVRFSPFFCPDFLPKFQRGWAWLNFAYYYEVFKHYWRPKGEALEQCPPPKYAPAPFNKIVSNRCRHSQEFTMECWTDIRDNIDYRTIRETSSVARGGGGGGGSSPPHWLVKYAKSHVFCAIEADFLWKKENSHPHTKRAPPQTFELVKLEKKSPWILAKIFFFFFFWRSPNFGRKKRFNFGFRPKNHSEFWRRPFFFGDHLILGGKNFEFPIFPRHFVSNFGQTVWNWFKVNENSSQGRLHTSHSFKIAPPPFPNPGYAPERD